MTGMEENQPEQLGNQQEMLLFGIEGIEILSFLYNDEIDSTQFTLLISRVLSSNLPLFMHLLGRQFSIWLQFQETATLALKYIAEQLSPTDSESLNRYFIDCPNLDERVLIFIANALQRGEPNNRAGFCPIGKLKNDTAASEYFPFNIVFLVVTYTEIKGLNIPINQISTIYNQMQLSLCVSSLNCRDTKNLSM